MNESMSLYELGRLIRLTLREGLPDAYWVQAEVSEVREAYNGHCYIELVQKAEREVLCWLRRGARYGPTCSRC